MIQYHVDKRLGILYLSGEISFATLPAFEKVIPTLVQSMPDNIRVDFAEVKVVSSAALILMLAMKRQAQQLNKSIQFIHFPQYMNRMIKLAALDKLLC